MAINKVEFGGETLIDLTGDSVTPETLMEGETAHNAAGEQITGTAKSGGGGSVQSDWNINDVNDPAYVKNRTHYTKSVAEKVILDNYTASLVDWGDGAYGCSVSTPDAEIIDGNIYIVEWDGTTYECMALDQGSVVQIGNAAQRGGDFANGEPFCIEFDPVVKYLLIFAFDHPATHTVSIKFDQEDVATIPRKYIKDMYGEGDLVNKVLVPPKTVDINGGIDFPLPFSLAFGDTYTVDFDGTAYNCVVWEADGMLFVGNGAIWGVPVEDTGEPFIFYEGWLDSATPGTHTISICKMIPKIFKINKKYFDAPTNLVNGTGRSSVQSLDSQAIGDNSHAEGSTIATGKYSHAEGHSTNAKGECSHSEGRSTNASGDYSHAEGRNTTASGQYSHSEGRWTTASNHASHAQGKLNKPMTDGGADGNTVGDAMVIGNGTGSNSRSNAFRVTFAGETYGLSAFNSSGADYAEFFEWADLNPNAEDRVGYFVTLDGKHIRIAKPGDYILGIVSGQPCIIGNSDEDWLGRWEHDEFGRFIKEEVDTPVTEMRPVKVPVTDKNGNQIGKLTKTEMQEVETGEVIKGWRYKANPDYDPTQQYVERKDRQEWDCVGMLGVLSVRDDGTCEVNGFCTVADGGIATEADSYVPGMTYRVIERMSENVVKVVFR